MSFGQLHEGVSFYFCFAEFFSAFEENKQQEQVG
jgi:hypothetical protein